MVKPPVVLHIRSKDAVYYTTYSDGSAGLSYCFPDVFEIYEPHAIKLIYVHGFSKPVYLQFTYIEFQGHNREPIKLLGTSLPGSNTYIPISTEYIPASGGIIIKNMDDTPINQLDDCYLGLHLVPIRTLPTWHH